MNGWPWMETAEEAYERGREDAREDKHDALGRMAHNLNHAMAGGSHYDAYEAGYHQEMNEAV